MPLWQLHHHQEADHALGTSDEATTWLLTSCKQTKTITRDAHHSLKSVPDHAWIERERDVEVGHAQSFVPTQTSFQFCTLISRAMAGKAVSKRFLLSFGRCARLNGNRSGVFVALGALAAVLALPVYLTGRMQQSFLRGSANE